MQSYWEKINFQPETNEMNFEETATNEEDITEVEKVDQVWHNSRKASISSEMAGHYSGVVVTGLRKETDLNNVADVLKGGGLPRDYAKEDFQTFKRGEFITIKVPDLKPDACVEIVNNFHRQNKFGSRISVYSLVDDSPIKQSGQELEKLIEEKANSDDEREALAKQEAEKTSSNSGTGIISNLVRFFNASGDLDISDDSDKESDDIPDADKAETFKRKIDERSPEQFELSKKEQKL